MLVFCSCSFYSVVLCKVRVAVRALGPSFKELTIQERLSEIKTLIYNMIDANASVVNLCHIEL